MGEDLGSIGRQMLVDRHLDIQVARLVFGLQVELRDNSWGINLYTGDTKLLNYSTSINLAWDVLEKVQSTLSVSENSRLEVLVNYPYRITSVPGKEAAQKICQAAVDIINERK